MKVLVFSTLVFLIFLFGNMGFVSAAVGDNDRTVFAANVLAPRTQINVPDFVDFGDVSSGFVSERIRIDIENTGSTSVEVTPRLVNSGDEIFSNLYFFRRVKDDPEKIGRFSINLDAPSTKGGIEDDYFYARLDLSNYGRNLESDLLDQRAAVVFWAVPA